MFGDYEIPWLALDLPNTTFLFEKEQNLTNELALFGFMGSLLMIAFSKERHETDAVMQLRLRSFIRAVQINSVILLICTAFTYSFLFVEVLVLNLFSTLIIFILIFHTYRTKLSINN